jgi:hypothetical protein
VEARGRTDLRVLALPDEPETTSHGCTACLRMSAQTVRRSGLVGLVRKL